MRTAGKIERALGMNLGLKPHRCNSPKCPYLRRQARPGVHGRNRRRALSEYGRELVEKQRLRFSYGLDEKILKRYVSAAKARGKDAGLALLSLLERRLDNVFVRAGIASSRRQARLLIRHGHFSLNGKPVRSPSLLVSTGDILTVREGKQEREFLHSLQTTPDSYEPPAWLSVSRDPLTIDVKRLPEPEELTNFPFDTRLVVEYYSR